MLGVILNTKFEKNFGQFRPSKFLRPIFLASQTDFSHFWFKNDALCACTDDQTFIQRISLFENQDAIS